MKDSPDNFNSTMNNNSKTISPSEHITAFDHIRLIACLMVILTHVSAQWTDSFSGGRNAGFIFSLSCNIISFSGVVLFIMTSGALYLAPSHAGSGSVRHMAERSFHFLLLYAIWKLIYLLEDCITEPAVLEKEGFKEHVILAFFRLPGKYHLWYLPMLAVLLILVPLIFDSVRRRQNCLLYLFLFLILAIILPTLFNFEFPFKYLLMDFRNLFDLTYFTGYLGYFILGYYLWEYRNNFTIRKLAFLWILTAAVSILSVAAAVSRSMTDAVTFYGFSSPFSAGTFLLSCAVFLTVITGSRTHTPAGIGGSTGSSCLSDSAENTNHISRIRPVSSRAASATFGIYLVHPAVLDLFMGMRLLHTGGISLNPFIGIPLLTLVVGGISLLCTILLRRIPIVRHLVM